MLRASVVRHHIHIYVTLHALYCSNCNTVCFERVRFF